MKKVLVAGHICLDITPVFSPENSGENLQLEPGKLCIVGPADLHTGGAVANTGLAMHFLGAQVKLLAKIGTDTFGAFIEDSLLQSGAAVSLKKDPDSPSSYSVVIAPPNTDRTFLHCPGANDSFTDKDIAQTDLDGIGLFHFGYPPLMRNMYLNNGAMLTHMMQEVHNAGIVTSLDLAGVDPSSAAGSADWKTILKDTLPHVDIFVPSFEEICYMLRPDWYQDLCRIGGDMCLLVTIAKLKGLAEELVSYGASCVLLKAGAAGMYYATGSWSTLTDRMDLKPEAWLNRSGYIPSYRPDRICSGTGAGDTAIAAFLTCILKGYDLERAAHLAAAAGAASVEAYDAISALKPLDELESRIRHGWEQQKLIG